MRFNLTFVSFLITFPLLYLVPNYTFSQGNGTYVPLNKDVYHLIDRYEIKSGKMADEFYSSYKPYSRKSVVQLLNTLENDSSNIEFSKTDQFNLDYLRTDNWQYDTTGSETALSKAPTLKHFYRTKSDFYSVDSKAFKLRVNPTMHVQAGKDNSFAGSLYTNTRGITVEGMIDDKIGFYTFMADNQIIFPSYVQTFVDSNGVVPGQGFLKPIGSKANSGDFFTARGYFTFNVSKHIDVQFGHDRQFVGNGYRSLILSDFSPNYMFLKFSTQIWKFKYTNLFTEMSAEIKGVLGDRILNKKYLAFHHLSLNVTKNLNLGLFEANPYGRDNGSVELQYLNPIIFYRSVEQQLGSGDNAILGADFKYNFMNHFSAYGQVVLDEMIVSKFRAGGGAWENKQAFQLGGKYIDAFGISNLDFQIERNYIRPFVYSHKDNYRSYSHYNQALAHPIGSSVKEVLLIGRFQPIPQLELKGRIMLASFAQDTGSTNFGTNVLRDYSSYGNLLGHFTAEPTRVDLRKIDLIATFQVKQNIFLDATITKRTTTSALPQYNSDATIISGALRWNIRDRRHDF